ncbi:hypothetical protein [Tenggerimyces flavus]|uniref:Alpha-L-arabinofuranosidase n=1 Tax=Tenggerimyces flavus TaxID=1708749 RepID=A0ABV7YNN4_9ACTN|nr:hypothetical protein [Tenggerimyces flavus]MBM7784810.1 hypothetical protein [Tenggerimyces flavus]
MAARIFNRRTVLGGIGGAALVSALPATGAYAADTGLWRLGNIGAGAGSSSEFRDYAAANPEVVPVPADWATRTVWNDVLSKGLKASLNRTMDITYSLGSVPANGVRFEVKVIKADRAIPQLGVYSNGTMVGMIQIAGLDAPGVTIPHQYVKTYQLYIPKEFLKTGGNVLRLEAVRSFRSSATEDARCSWEWDHLRMIALGSPAPEPWHGRYTHLGTAIMEGHFGYNANAISVLPDVLEWLGIAHSGNVVRAGFWSDVEPEWTAHGAAYLNELKAHTMQVVANHLNARQYAPGGTLTQAGKDKLDQFWATYGANVQFYEVDNEPGIFGSTKEQDLAVGAYAAASAPSHVRIVAPGWAYKAGTWEANASERREVEDLCDLTNGHSYGPTYSSASPGGSFGETLLTYAPITDGLPKQMLVTETGTTDAHVDNANLAHPEPKAAAFDRIMRAHVGFVDHILQHAAFFRDTNNIYQLFEVPADWTQPEDITGHRFDATQQTRLEIFRRLAAAYATHGAPLTYVYLGSPAANRKVYTRAVNTATLPGLPGNNAKSNKVLINVVNFGHTQEAVAVRVTMPSSGTWTGRRFGRGNVCGSAQAPVTLTASPTVDLNLTLVAGEAVQYILGRA